MCSWRLQPHVRPSKKVLPVVPLSVTSSPDVLLLLLLCPSWHTQFNATPPFFRTSLALTRSLAKNSRCAGNHHSARHHHTYTSSNVSLLRARCRWSRPRLVRTARAETGVGRLCGSCQKIRMEKWTRTRPQVVIARKALETMRYSKANETGFFFQKKKQLCLAFVLCACYFFGPPSLPLPQQLERRWIFSFWKIVLWSLFQ